MAAELPKKRIIGYPDRVSAAPGEEIRFMVSRDGVASYRADIVRLVSGDLHPGDFHRMPGGLAHQMEAGGVAVLPARIGVHRLKDLIRHPRRRVIVQVDHDEWSAVGSLVSAALIQPSAGRRAPTVRAT